MSERMNPGNESNEDIMPLNGLDWQLLRDVSNPAGLRRELSELQQEFIRVQNRLDNVRELLTAAAERKLPFGVRFHAQIGEVVAEVWRKNDEGEYVPHGYVDTAGEKYPFIADSIKMVQIGSAEALLLTNESFNLGITVHEIKGTLETADIETEVMFADFYKFVELVVDQDGDNKIALDDLLGPSESPQA